MNLADRQSARRLDRVLARLGCLLVAVSMLVSLIVEPPRAKATVDVSLEVTQENVCSLLAGYMSSAGISLKVSGMETPAEMLSSLGNTVCEFLDTEVGGQSIIEWGADACNTVLESTGVVILGRALADNFGKFTDWLLGKYAKNEDGTIGTGVYQIGAGDAGVYLRDGSIFVATRWDSPLSGKDSSGSYPFVPDPSSIGTAIRVGDRFEFIKKSNRSNYYIMHYSNLEGTSDTFEFCIDSNGDYFSNFIMNFTRPVVGSVYDSPCCVFIGFDGSRYWIVSWSPSAGYRAQKDITDWDFYFLSPSATLSINVADTYQQILNRLTALEENQTVALGLGTVAGTDLQTTLDAIGSAILAGNFSPVANVVPVVPVINPDPDPDPKPDPDPDPDPKPDPDPDPDPKPDPDPDPNPPAELPDVSTLGLPELGNALTSRFPFCIPWDVSKGISLLSAPAKTPYFEVDLLAPIADRVGGWEGSTKIVLDFSKYEIIGKVSRWTSTIGFCLVLASATKRLIWTS